MEKMYKPIYALLGTIGFLLIVLAMQPGQTTGQAVLSPIQIKGSITPRIDDGANITFMAGNMIIASDLLKNSEFGPVWIKLDDPNKFGRQGYIKGDYITVLIEGIPIGEISYLESNRPTKNITIPATIRPNISTAVFNALNCKPEWRCSEWTTCKDEKQERKCIDMNNCRFDGKPEEKRNCNPPVVYEEPTMMSFLEEYGKWIYLGIGLLAILIGVSAATKRPKKRTKK